jgi:arylsulfatase A-like enzyme
VTLSRRFLLRATAIAALAAAAAALPGACGDGDAPEPATVRRGRYDPLGRLVEGTRARGAPPNVVLVIADTVRADAIRGRDGAPPVMPRLAAWARGAADFVDASASGAWTAPSVTTTLTGLLPSAHGVQGRMEANELATSVTTLAEILQAAGYTTIAFTGGGWVSREMGLSQGFEQFVDPWSTLDPRKALRRRLADVSRDQPLFLMLHTYEAHDPYGRKDPPEGSDDPARVAATTARVDRYVDYIRQHRTDMTPDEGRELLLSWRSDPLFTDMLSVRVGDRRLAGAAAIWYQWFDHAKDPQRATTEATLRARYERGLGMLDTSLAQVLETIDAAELPGRTVTIVLSDHGEAFGENGTLFHGRWLYDPITRVVLLVRAPGRFPVGPVRGSCGLIDVLPTILEACGLPIPEGAPGRSLLARARGKETGHPVMAEDFRRRPLGSDQQITVRTVSVRTERAKLILTWDPRDDSVVEQLYDLVAGTSARIGDIHPYLDRPADLGRRGPQV